LVNVSCTRRIATVTVAARLIGVENGSVVYSNTFKKTAIDDLCEGDILSSFTAPRDLLEQAKNAVLKAMLYDLAPHYETFNLPLIEDVSITPKSAAESYLSGLEFAKSKRLDRACEFWQKAYRQNASHYAILYSLGICSEVGGNLSEALRWYTQADRALNHPDEVISAALSRIREQIRNKGK
jgi:TPR repeat protein